jgi:hypothetical protein
VLRLAPFTEREIRTAVNTTVRLIETAPTKVPPPASSRLPESSKERSVVAFIDESGNKLNIQAGSRATRKLGFGVKPTRNAPTAEVPSGSSCPMIAHA